jgi:hypothetical protein
MRNDKLRGIIKKAVRIINTNDNTIQKPPERSQAVLNESEVSFRVDPNVLNLSAPIKLPHNNTPII